MKRLTAISSRDSCDELCRRLVWLSCVDVDVMSPEDVESLSLSGADVTAARRRIEGRIAAATTAIDVLSPHSKVKKKLFSPKPELERGDPEPEREQKASDFADDACRLGEKIAKTKSDIAKLTADADAIEPWRDYDLTLSFAGTRYTDVTIGSLPSGSAGESDLERFTDETGGAIIYKNEVNGVVYVSVLTHKDDTAAALRWLTSAGFVKSPASQYDKTAADVLDEITVKIEQLTVTKDGLSAEADTLAEAIPEIEMYHDAERTRMQYAEARSRMPETESTVYVAGWVPAASVGEVEEMLNELGCAYEFDDPDPETEDVPVKLKNNKFAESFEPVVELYALPKYGTYDPTFVMSIFYMILFGFMFADFGYGLVVSLACILGLKLMKPRGTLNKFLRMFAICGISSMVCGILLGGYFGDLPGKMATGFFGVAEEPDLAVWFNPINDPMTFLVVSIALGAVHLIGALSVKFYILCKTKTVWDAIFDAGSWILVFLGGILMAVGMGAGVGALTVPGIVVLALGYAILIATQGRAEKSIVMKIGKGLMSLYDTISYVSDLLSYSRVLSLGLASAVIGSVFNLLGTLAGPSFFGLIIFVIAILIGHTLNIAINLLGTFVHTSRLQYIEFFGKFYESGGRAFVPLEPDPKFYVYKQKANIA